MRGDSSDQVDRAWREHSAYLIARCRAWMHGDREHAQEAFSRAWLRAAGQLPLKCGEIVDVRRWLTRIAYHACMDLYREIRRRAENSLEEEESATPLQAGRSCDPERRLLDHERLIVLQTAYDELPERLRNAMQRYLQSASYREMARHLGITEENARKRVQEARTILRRWLADYEAGGVRRRRRHTAGTHRPQSPLRTLAVRTVARRLPGGAVVHEEVFLTAATPAADREKLQRYVERHPRGWKRALELAHALAARGEAEAALPHLLAVLRRNPAATAAWLDTAELLRALARGGELRVLEEWAEFASVPAAERAVLAGIAAAGAGAARMRFEEARALAPEAARPLVELARLALAEGALAEAVAHAESAARVDPTDAGAHAIAFDALAAAGRGHDALRHAVRARVLDPGLPARYEKHHGGEGTAS